MRIAIVCFNRPGYQWDDSDTATGLFGSEEAVVYASTELAKLGHYVVIFGSPHEKPWWKKLLEYVSFQPRYVSIEETEKYSKYFDMVVLWRRWDTTAMKHLLKNEQGKIYMWLHDVPWSGECISENSEEFIRATKANEIPQIIMHHDFKPIDVDGIFYLSEYHKNCYHIAYPNITSIPHVICGNGIVPEQFTKEDVIREKYTCVYASNYSRGLKLLLEIWPNIKTLVPYAKLKIFYGRETWGQLTGEEFYQITDRIRELAILGVEERGKIGHQELAREMKKGSILAYPCTTLAETFCITAIKAQAAGMIPVTIRLGALQETIHPDAPSLNSLGEKQDISVYTDLLVNTLKSVDTIDRNKYIEFGNKYTWKRCVESWLDMYQSMT